MDAGAQVEGLKAPDVVLDVLVQPGADPVQGLLVVGDAGAHHQVLHVLQGLGDLLPAGHLAHALHAVGVGEDDDVAGEVGGVGAGEVELHAVMAGHGVDLHVDNGRDHG